jgi:hypothetical protein
VGNLVPKIFQCYRLGGDRADSRRPMRDSLRSYLAITARFVSVAFLGPKYHRTRRRACKVLQNNHRPLSTCSIPSSGSLVCLCPMKETITR